jgi:chemotaxis protein MotB
MKCSSPAHSAALVLCGIAAILVAGGCVSSKTHEKMQADKDSEIAALQQEKSAVVLQKSDLEQQAATLEQQKAEMEQQKAELEQQTAALGQQKTELERQVDTLEKQKSFLQRLTISLDEEKSALESANRQRQAQHDALVGQLSEEIRSGELQVRQYQNMLTVDVAEQLFFDSGHADIKGSGRAVLKKVGEVLKGYDNKLIWVVGHTDSVPIGKALQATFATNWELSVARATNVVRALQDAGVPPAHMVASGRGEFFPVAPNDTETGRQQNRRIEIMLIDARLVEEMLRPK